jgi:hypothetical protein
VVVLVSACDVKLLLLDMAVLLLLFSKKKVMLYCCPGFKLLCPVG